MKLFVSPVHAHRRQILAEENFNNLVESMAHSVDTSRPLSPACTSIVQCAHEHVAMVAGMEVRHGLQTMLFHLPRPCCIWPLLNAQSANSRDQHGANSPG